MKKGTKIKIGIGAAVAVAVAIAGIILGSRHEFHAVTLTVALIFIGILLLGFLIWKAFIKGGAEDLKREKSRSRDLEQEIKSLRMTVQAYEREREEQLHTKLNIVHINPVLHVAVMSIDTAFTRTYIRESEDGITFNGALRTDICADYGIRMEDARFKYDPATNTLNVANFNPGLISYSKKQLTWDIARSYRTRTILGHEIVTVSDKACEEFTKKTCETLRTELEKEIDERQITEFDWLSPAITGRVTEVLKLLVGDESVNIRIAESSEADDTYVSLSALKAQLSTPLIDGQQQ